MKDFRLGQDKILEMPSVESKESEEVRKVDWKLDLKKLLIGYAFLIGLFLFSIAIYWYPGWVFVPLFVLVISAIAFALGDHVIEGKK